MNRDRAARLVVGSLIVVAALVVRYLGLSYVTADMRDYFLPWYEQAVAAGGWPALAEGVSNYAPPYDYLFIFVTQLRAWINPVVGLKLIPIAFDLGCAGWMYLLARERHGASWAPVLAMAVVLFAPTVIINSAYWGQVDSIYTSFLVACLFFIVHRRLGWASLMYGVALSFKFQAIFLAPFLLALVARELIPWRYAVVPPAVYLLLATPAALFGRPLIELITLYAAQTDQFPHIALSAPNLYMLCAYQVESCVSPTITWLALGAAALGAVGLVWVYGRRHPPLDAERLVAGTTLTLVLMPFLLPRMHERYFYPADVFSIALALYQPRLWWLPISFQVASLLGYSGYLLGAPAMVIIIGGFVNLASILFLILYTRRIMFPAKVTV